MKMKLRDFGEIITGNTPSKKTIEFWDSEDICFVKPDTISDTGITDITDTNEYISEFARSKARVVGENAIFVTCIGSIGKIGIAKKGEYAFNQQINAIIPNSKINPKYLAYAILAAKPKLIAIANAPVVPIINKSQFGDFEIEISENMNEQKNIVEVLDTTKAIIEARKQELQKLDELIKARFVEMFGDGKYSQTTIAELVSGKVPSVKKDFSPEDIIKYIDISSIDNKQNVMTGYTEYVVKEAPSRAQQHISKGDIVISTVRPNLRNVAITQYEDDNLVASSGFCVLRADKCLPEYLMAIVTSDKFTDDMTKVVTGANYPAIKDSDVMSYQVALPPIEMQEQFTTFVKQLDKSKVVAQKALEEAQLLFDSLMQKYFG